MGEFHGKAAMLSIGKYLNEVLSSTSIRKVKTKPFHSRKNKTGHRIRTGTSKQTNKLPSSAVVALLARIRSVDEKCFLIFGSVGETFV